MHDIIDEKPEDPRPWAIVELTPDSPHHDHHRLVVMRDSKEDCETILKALEETNVFFDCYRILPFSNDLMEELRNN